MNYKLELDIRYFSWYIYIYIRDGIRGYLPRIPLVESSIFALPKGRHSETTWQVFTEVLWAAGPEDLTTPADQDEECPAIRRAAVVSPTTKRCCLPTETMNLYIKDLSTTTSMFAVIRYTLSSNVAWKIPCKMDLLMEKSSINKVYFHCHV